MEHQIRANSPEFNAATRAMACGGFSAFSVMYGLQPLMPMLSNDFHVSASVASGVISSVTAGLALCLIPAGSVARRFGLKKVMTIALASTAMFSLLAISSSNFTQLLLWRGLLGVALAGFPAVGMAYLSEEIESKSLGRAIGIYIAGNALGGLLGRLIAAIVADYTSSWRVSLACLGLLSLGVAIIFWRLLPNAKSIEVKPLNAKALVCDIKLLWQDEALPWLFLQSFLLMGCYVSFYSYLNYRLVSPPFSLSHSSLGFIALMNGVGMLASTCAGRWADQCGRPKVMVWMVAMMMLSLVVTLSSNLIILVVAVAVFTFGFFGAHAVGSGWVGQRPLKAKALAASFYLSAYYMGASWMAPLVGIVWGYGGWGGVITVLVLVQSIMACVIAKLRTAESLGEIRSQPA